MIYIIIFSLEKHWTLEGNADLWFDVRKISLLNILLMNCLVYKMSKTEGYSIYNDIK